MNYEKTLLKNYFSFLDDSYYQSLRDESQDIVLYGAGGMGECVFKDLLKNRVQVKCFCDTNPAKWGKTFMDLPVKSYEQVKKDHENPLFIVTFSNTEEVFPRLEALGERVARPRLNVIVGEKFNYDFFEDHKGDFERARGLFEDEKSREIFDKLLLYRLTYDSSLTIPLHEKDMYFPKDLVDLTDREVFVDAGAFHGETSLEFKDRVKGAFKALYLFEPDPLNMDIIKKTGLAGGGKETVFVQAGAWDSKTELSFQSSGNSTARVDPGGSVKIPMDTIDNLCKAGATFIKLDVEGSELQALKGAERTIKTKKPKIAVSAYHRREDFFAIPFYIKGLLPSYRLYMRHHTDALAETVIYAL